MPAELPGLYFDQAKNRYYKVQSHHVAAEGTGYSQQAVELVQEEQARVQSQTEHRQRQLNATIQRAPILQRPLIRGLSLQREVIEDQRRLMRTRASLWADGLEQRKFIAVDEYISHTVRDQATKTVCFVTDNYAFQPSKHPTFACTPLARHSEEGQKRYHVQSMRHKCQSLTSSFCLSPCRVLITTTFGGTAGQFSLGFPTLVASCLTPADLYLSGLKNLDESPPVPRTTDLKRFDDGPVVSLKFRANCTLWTSATGPQTDDLVVAVTIDDSIGQYKGPHLQFDSMGPLSLQSDALSLDYQDHNVILSGYRNGSVGLWDTRSRASTVRLRHPSSVVHVRAMTGHRIAVAGLSNQLCVYDLRYTKEHREGVVTKPFLTFSEHKNMATVRPQLGFGVHQNLVAAATDDNSFHIFDAVSGQALPIGGSCEQSGSLEGPARCIEFVDDDGGWGDGLRLLVAHSNKIDEWAW
ncbi:MAG: hypothetical protein Q9214_002819 [Letrouitia sp. 1 TL-2023]